MRWHIGTRSLLPDLAIHLPIRVRKRRCIPQLNQRTEKFGAYVTKAMEADLQKLIDMGAYEPVKDIKKKVIIRSSMFLTAKLDANGNHFKWKARIVADGSTQDKPLCAHAFISYHALAASKIILKIAQTRAQKV